MNGANKRQTWDSLDSVMIEDASITMYQSYGLITVWYKQLYSTKPNHTYTICLDIDGLLPKILVVNPFTDLVINNGNTFASGKLHQIKIGLQWEALPIGTVVKINQMKIIINDELEIKPLQFYPSWVGHDDLSEIYSNSVDSVVRVMQRRDDGITVGCGVVVCSDPVLILTGYDIVSDKQPIFIQLTSMTSKPDGYVSKIYDVTLSGYSELFNLAVLSSDKLPAIKSISIADSALAGESILFVSHAFSTASTGQYLFGAETVSQGIIRNTKVKFGGSPVDMISCDFDTAIGDQYGAVINRRGQLVGLYQQKEQNTIYPSIQLNGVVMEAPSGSVTGLIPYDVIDRIISNIVEYVDSSDEPINVEHAWIGIETIDIGLFIYNYIINIGGGKHWVSDDVDVIGTMVSNEGNIFAYGDILTHVSLDGIKFMRIGSMNEHTSLSHVVLNSLPGTVIQIKYRKLAEYHDVEHVVDIKLNARPSGSGLLMY